MTERTDHTGRDGRGHVSGPTTHRDFEILSTVPVGVLVLRRDASFLFANEAAASLFGGTAALSCLAETFCPTDGTDLEDNLRHGHRFEAIVAGTDSHRQVMVSVAELARVDEPDFVVSLTDITELKRATEHAEFLAHHDPLTRLGNRTLLQSVWDAVEERLSAGEDHIHALALDLDRFKEVNDQHGHAMGDLVLRQAAERIRTAVGDAGQVFRFGGDEFFVMLDGLSRETAIEVGRQIVEAVSEPMSVLGHRITIGCSVGIASAPLDGTRRDALHRASDMALYDVKHEGRGDVACFDPLREQSMLDQRLLQADLIVAMANDAIELRFEAQHDSVSGEIESVEAGLSWTNGRTGQTLSSDDLRALAKEAALSYLLDLWSVRHAVSRFVERHATESTCRHVAVTVDAATLLNTDLVDATLHVLADCKLSPDRLELQVVERAVLASGEALTPAIRRLTDAGVRIVIIGFGADRPDLGYLRSLGVARLKLDRNLAAQILGDADAEAMMGAVWTLCQRLGIEMSADGIETDRQWRALQRFGRMRAQGPYFACTAETTSAAVNRCADAGLG